MFPDEIEHLMALERLIGAWLRCHWCTRANRSEVRREMTAPLGAVQFAAAPRPSLCRILLVGRLRGARHTLVGGIHPKRQ